VAKRVTDVVTCFVSLGDKVLLLRRSRYVGSHRGRWAGVSGYLEADHTPLQQAHTELEEELGLASSDVVLLCEAGPLVVEDPEDGRLWRVHPMRFELVANAGRLRLNWEHTDMAWNAPQDIASLATVPGLALAWEAVRQGGTASETSPLNRPYLVER
jgi:ADP-ribose pyrophosphatase YjhB (NUDIX family)